MKSKTNKQISRLRRRYLLPFILILFLLIALFVKIIKNFEFDVNFVLPTRSEIINPLPSPTAKEELENFLRQGGLTPTNLNFRQKEVEGSFSGNLTVFFSLDKDLFSQVISLQFILSRSKIEGKLPKLVDLRFRKPVISY